MAPPPAPLACAPGAPWGPCPYLIANPRLRVPAPPVTPMPSSALPRSRAGCPAAPPGLTPAAAPIRRLGVLPEQASVTTSIHASSRDYSTASRRRRSSRAPPPLEPAQPATPVRRRPDSGRFRPSPPPVSTSFWSPLSSLSPAPSAGAPSCLSRR
jgi:hypothetical protein